MPKLYHTSILVFITITQQFSTNSGIGFSLVLRPLPFLHVPSLLFAFTIIHGSERPAIFRFRVNLRWDGSHSAEVNEKPGLQSGPGLLLVSGLAFALGQSCITLILKRVLVAH